ncbi:putative MFS-type transporter PB1E7.08c [Grifola frondosa]|uniref:Putative MFS-type transporter PB1E7.08c n=1 Tax=Grifola frondosa TaxID=5627 RepID=A0A1C7LWB0_GRIFR|nr:putative MFS-type transporter PB1E7.08c [Grifola frondosa]
MSYFTPADDEDLDVEGLGFEATNEYDGRTPLDKTIDRIGMGSYQWILLSLCGFGWMADNMWLQAVAIALPRVQQHFAVRDSYIGTLSSSMFGGMMLGAIGWGTCSDLMGRTMAFNATLFLTSVFGIIASLANSFVYLCISLFLLGSAIGGSMPTDGTLLLEHMPNGKQYLVTALSIFSPSNVGWKYLLIVLGLITLSMFLARMVFFRLHESPRFLVHAGRPQEALESLQLISRFNGSEISLGLHDVEDSVKPPALPDAASPAYSDSGDAVTHERPATRHYSAIGESDVVLDSHSFGPPISAAHAPRHLRHSLHTEDQDPRSLESVVSRSLSSSGAQSAPSSGAVRSHSRSRSRSSGSSHGSVCPPYGLKSYVSGKHSGWLRGQSWAWMERVAMVLTPEWLKTTILVWFAWFAMSLAYTMFNVFLPKLLETRSGTGDASGAPKSLTDSLWDVVIYSLGGCPGAILGAYLIESPLGRRWSLAGSTFVTAFFCWIFVTVQHPWAVRASTIGISLSATAMWAVLYGWTPEIFGTKVRGTACGIASALSRIGGMIAPILGGTLLMVDHSLPVYVSIVVFFLAGICVLLLDEHDAERGSERILVH